jgi:hypothetical protein
MQSSSRYRQHPFFTVLISALKFVIENIRTAHRTITAQIDSPMTHDEHHLATYGHE